MASFLVEQGGDASISALHSDIITSHILTRLDGPTLASAACTSSQLRAFSADQTLWKDICATTWPSVSDKRVHDIISTFPSGHRSFFSDSFPLLDHSACSSDTSSRLVIPASELISAVDIFYKGELVFSKVHETETETGWFLCSPFRIDLLDPKETVPTPIRHIGETNESLNIEIAYLCVTRLFPYFSLPCLLVKTVKQFWFNLYSLELFRSTIHGRLLGTDGSYSV